MMKRILCYGDSNTWGANPAGGDRLDENTRWTGVLQNKLGEGYRIIEEGCNGRTTVWDDPVQGHKNGYAYLLPCLESQRPLDLIIIMLGTNDLKERFSVAVEDIAKSAGRLVKEARGYFYMNGYKMPEILLISPIEVADNIEESIFNESFGGRSAIERSHRFAKTYEIIARELGCHYMSAADYAKASLLDALHMDGEEHYKLAEAIKSRVKEIIG